MPSSPVARDVPARSGEVERWIRELDDPERSERAVQELEQLGDPAAIEPLGKAWVGQDRPVRILQVIISLARPLTPEQAKAKFVIAYERSGRPASWSAALPYLRKAIAEVDAANPRSVDAATKAADAIGEGKLAGALDALIEIVQRPPSKQLLQAQIAATRALGKLAVEKVKAAAALTRLIDREPPAHPRTANGKEVARALEVQYGMFLASTGAAVNALGELRIETATKPLILSLYRTPELTSQIRRALVASGPGAKDELKKILARKHAEVEQLFRSRRLDKYCGDKGELPADRCRAVGLQDFYAALLLGDYQDPKSVPELLAALERPPVPAYFMDDQPGPTQHNAVFDALRKLGAPEAAPKLRALWTKRANDLQTRILAIAAYPFVARDTAGVDELGKIAADNTADDGLRQEAATAYARLANDPKHVAPLQVLASKYLDAAAKKRAAAETKRAGKDAADATFEKAKQTHDAAKTKLLAIARDPASTVDEIRAATAAAKQAETDFKQAKQVHRDKVREYKQLETAAKAYVGFARLFQTHIARIVIARRCKDDVACYAASLSIKPADAASHVATFIKDLDQWTEDDKLGLVEASIDRAMLELGKRGAKASAVVDVLLDSAKSDNRIIRQAILLALPKIATLPCPRCVVKLEQAIAAGEGKTTLGELQVETQIVRSYFEWAR
jgi:hypothetical protein